MDTLLIPKGNLRPLLRRSCAHRERSESIEFSTQARLDRDVLQADNEVSLL